MDFKKLNNLVGWVVFALASILYLLTIETKFSFWDCGEYIVSSAKLGVTHAPGAAVFQLVGAVWAGLAFGNGALYSILINALSALSSSLTILFLFWTITHLARRLFLKNSTSLSSTQIILILGAGVLGAACFAFSDSFWFSAVEGEVYAMASMFTALMLWLACKWENDAGLPRENKWLILISLLIGLSVGVHLMAILVVPAICYIYYFRHYEFTWKSFAIANLITILIFYFIFKVIFSYTMSFFGKLEIFLINTLGMPFQSGLLVGIILFFIVFFFALWYTQKKNWVTANTVVLSILFMIIGFSSWLVIPIRATANPHMNLNDPDDAIGLLNYFNREQYGDWPVFYGPLYTAHMDSNGVEKNPDGTYKRKDDGPIYKKNKKKGIYEEVGRKYSYVYSDAHTGIFARMHNPQMADNYQAIMGEVERYQSYDPVTGEQTEHIRKPSLWQNIQFFLNYQVGYMYLRYFGWNFVGRQNDFEGHLEVTKGNTITGIPFIDSYFLGDQGLLPKKFKDNKARNIYFGIPLILGIIGFIFHWKEDPKRTFALISLFLLTGLGIILYTNNKPFEPRERDYAVVTSFFVFAIWLGLSLLSIFKFLRSKIKIDVKPSLGVTALAFIAPLLMGFQNWDDHDRSERLAAHDLAYNYLVNLDPNAILFVYGDNDTYPLWAIQETEEFRTDVKIANYTLLGSPWNISQAHRKTYQADAIPHQMTESDYREGRNEAILILSANFLSQLREYAAEQNPELLQSLDKIQPYNDNGMTAKEAMNWILKPNPAKNELLSVLKQVYNPNLDNILPTNKIIIPVNKENVIKNKLVSPQYYDKILPNLSITIPSNAINYKNELFMLDLFANYDWTRPIYFSSGGLYDNANIFYTNDYLQFESFSYKLVPLLASQSQYGSDALVDSEDMYQQIKKYRWANFNNPDAYFDQTSTNNILTYRNAVIRTAKDLTDNGEKEKAKEIIDLLMEKIPLERYETGYSLYGLIPIYQNLGENQKAEKLQDYLLKQNQEELNFYESLPPRKQQSILSDWRRLQSEQQYFAGILIENYLKKGQKEEAKKAFEKIYLPVVQQISSLIEKAKSVGLNNLTEKEQNELTSAISSQRSLIPLAAEIDSIYAEEKFDEVKNIMSQIGIEK